MGRRWIFGFSHDFHHPISISHFPPQPTMARIRKDQFSPDSLRTLMKVRLSKIANGALFSHRVVKNRVKKMPQKNGPGKKSEMITFPDFPNSRGKSSLVTSRAFTPNLTQFESKFWTNDSKTQNKA